MRFKETLNWNHVLSPLRFWALPRHFGRRSKLASSVFTRNIRVGLGACILKEPLLHSNISVLQGSFLAFYFPRWLVFDKAAFVRLLFASLDFALVVLQPLKWCVKKSLRPGESRWPFPSVCASDCAFLRLSRWLFLGSSNLGWSVGCGFYLGAWWGLEGRSSFSSGLFPRRCVGPGVAEKQILASYFRIWAACEPVGPGLGVGFLFGCNNKQLSPPVSWWCSLCWVLWFWRPAPKTASQ